MRFALVNNQRQEATPKTRGICPRCKKSVIAKCGSIRDCHWAHEIALGCKNDRWEKEGPWHQNWKNQFPKEWQEQSVPFNNEIHIADVKTPQGLVIEFQHSHIEPKEQNSRELAYGNMIWIVDGTRLPGDLYRFNEVLNKNKNNIENFFKFKQKFKINIIGFYKKLFNKNWISSKVPVVFDFFGLGKRNIEDKFDKYLVCLLPIRIPYNRGLLYQQEEASFLFYIQRKDFISIVKNNRWEYFYYKLYSAIHSIIYLSKICSAEQLSKYKQEISDILEIIFSKCLSEEGVFIS